MKYIKLLSRIVLGAVFIFSGFVKAVDPLGSAYKFSDYFSAFHMGFLEFLVLPLGIFLSAFELVLGISLLLGYRRRSIYPVLMWFMTFFTVLTFVLAIFNPVSDCGCFGDAVILTNWQTFLKNLVLMIFVLVLYLQRKHEKETGGNTVEWIIVSGLFGLVIWFSSWNYNHLPLLDFRPYDLGTNIHEEMEMPEGAPVDEYDTELIYMNKTTGKSEVFSISDYPRDTTEWEFVSSDSKLVSKGYEPPIHDFAIMDPYGSDLTDLILSDQGYSLLMIAHDLSKSDEGALMKAREWYQIELLSGDFSFYAVTASTSQEAGEVSNSLELGYTFHSADEIMQKTIVRSNPGFLMLKNGTIVGKWSSADFPKIEEVDPEWHELIGNASAPLDEEAQLLMEAGVFEDFTFEVIDLDQIMPGVLIERNSQQRERGVIIAFFLGIFVLLFTSSLISPVKV